MRPTVLLFSLFATAALGVDTYWFCNDGTPGDGSCNTFCCQERQSQAFPTRRKILGNASGPDHKTQKCQSGQEWGEIFCA
ncbi:extracellular protein 9-8 [Teratosphaeria destructans]|uniref:Extracellular protein 9-8 n=1 Tax=Teratosphaeria destructans TaxID=418781 RepID=A0A9W7SN43_9PEZI|nr:extracellular protein 9-8 [Teratosphaeria destructans]